MVSFDVESLFTNVPIEGAVKAALCKLENDPGLACEQALYSGGQRELFSLRAPKARVSANEVKASEASPR